MQLLFLSHYFSKPESLNDVMKKIPRHKDDVSLYALFPWFSYGLFTMRRI